MDRTSVLTPISFQALASIWARDMRAWDSLQLRIRSKPSA